MDERLRPLTLAEFAEREAARMRAELATLPSGTQRSAQLDARLSAYDKRPACPLTPAVLTLIGDIAGVDIDCGWHMVALGYQIKVRRVMGRMEYGADRLISDLELTESYLATEIWFRETIVVINEVRKAAGIGILTPERVAATRRCIEVATEYAQREATAP